MLKNRLILLLLLISVIQITPSTSGMYNKSSYEFSVITDITVIRNDTGLKTLSSSGDGSSEDPFVLLFNINTSSTQDLVSIFDTSQYFIIKDSILTGGKHGIVFNNVKNGRIESSTIKNNSWGGINLINSDINTIQKNSISYNVRYGIAFNDSDGNFVGNNFIYNHNGGHPGNLGLNPHLGGDGIIIDPSNDNTFIENIIYNNERNGIFGLDSNNANITRNKIFSNNVGVYFRNMSKSTIFNNNISLSVYGIFLENSNKLSINKNNLTSNTNNIFIENTIETKTITVLETTIVISDATIYRTQTNKAFTPINYTMIILTLVLLPIIKKKKLI